MSLGFKRLMDSDLVYWNNVRELLEELQLEHISGQRRLFTDLFNFSSKAVSLHNGNKFPSGPLAGAVHIKEKCKNLQVLLQKINHENLLHGAEFFLRS